MGNVLPKKKLSKNDLEFLVKHTSYDESCIKTWFKSFNQNCPDGKMRPKQFVEMYEILYGYSSNVDEFCKQAFRTFDTDNNGYIDFKEFLLAINVTTAGTPEKKLQWAFRMYDVDGNGTVSLYEMIKIVKAIYNMLGDPNKESSKPQESPEARAAVIFEKMDENHDGRLTQEEFLQGCLQDGEISQMLTAGF